MESSMKWVWRKYKAEYLLFLEGLGATDERITKKVANVETASQAKAGPILSTDECSQYKWLSSWKELEMGQ